MENYMKILSQSPIFANVDTDFLQNLLDTCPVVKLKSGDPVFQEGDTSSELYIILEGQIEIALNLFQDKQQLFLAGMDKGTSFGEMSLVSKTKRSASASAKMDSILLSISKDYLDMLLQENDSQANRMIYNIANLLSQRLKTATEMIASSQLKQAENVSEIAKFRERLIKEVLI